MCHSKRNTEQYATRLDSAWFVRLVRAPYLAAVLLVTIGIGIGIEVGHQRLAGPDVKLAARTIEVGPTVQQVGLLFNASEVLADASISVELPESIEIAGRPDVHRLSWRAYLKRGPNLLELPLVATGSGHGTLVVRVAQGSLVRTLEVPVTSQSSRPRAAVTVLGSAPVSS